MIRKELLRKKYIVRAKLLYGSEEFLTMCLLKLYEQQEPDEQLIYLTRHTNGVGFTKSDSSVLSEFATTLLEGEKLEAWQIKDIRHRIIKYAAQLLDLLSWEELEQ